MKGGGIKFVCFLSFYCSMMPSVGTDKIVYALQTNDINIALRRPVLSSGGDSPANANDGISDPSWRNNPCIIITQCGNCTSGYWWQVDFGDVMSVEKVLVTNRGDCCPGRIADFSLDVYHSDPSVDPTAPAGHCASFSGPMSSPGVTETFNCEESIKGRFLRISQPASQLQFCELQAYGTLTDRVEPCGLFRATSSSRYSSSTIETAGPDVTSRAECAAECGKITTCTGFNIKYPPDGLCELILGAITGSPSASSIFDFYKLDPCWYVCD